MTIGGTSAYAEERDLPDLVSRAVALAEQRDFPYSCLPAQGRLLQTLARGRMGGAIGETGTGCGVGLAWMASAVDAHTRLVSAEIDADRARAVARLFADLPNVTVLEGPWQSIIDYSPFDLLVLDGGGTGKPAEVSPDRADPGRLLTLGGTLVVDDFSPSDEWPPLHDGNVDLPRLYWLEHPELLATQIQVTPEMVAVIATKRPASP